tara:strand:- start:900 stop:1109 length:210 start_codon:yes stop_codon:yes gene_type:complete
MIKIKELNDRTNGFRFKVLGVTGLTRKRQSGNRKYGFHSGGTMVGVHMGRRSIYIERKNPIRGLYNFVG